MSKLIVLLSRDEFQWAILIPASATFETISVCTLWRHTMTEMHWFLEKGGGFLQNINRFGLEELQALFEENGLNEGADAAFLQISALLAPKPVTVDYFLQRDPYTKPEATKERFKGAQERGWITDLGDGNFGPTEKSVELTKKIFAILDDSFQQKSWYLKRKHTNSSSSSGKLWWLLQRIKRLSPKRTSILQPM